MKRTIVLIKQLIVLMLYGLSFLVPRHQRIWVLGSNDGYSYNDNSRHLYEYVCKNVPSIRAIWLTRVPQIMADLRRAGHESYLINSWQAYWLSCRAGIVIASHFKLDICYYAISRAIKINLWHGCPLKRIAFDSKLLTQNKIPFYRIDLKIGQIISDLGTGKKWDRLISTSPIMSDRMANAFGVDIRNVKVTGYPRNDILLHHDFKSLPIIDSLKATSEAKKIILYAPTWREDHQDSISLFDSLFLNEYNVLLLIKMHFENRETNCNVIYNEKGKCIYWLKEEDAPDFNYLLPYVDVLITDYSGAYFDFLLLDRPIIFAPFDLEKYDRCRGLYENYDEATAGPKCFSWDEVMVQLQEFLSGEDKFKALRKLALKKYHTFVDANSCYRVANFAKELAKLK
jgi:CDP-glycerol glycerophosphotransferase (TagB/SpsB family)